MANNSKEITLGMMRQSLYSAVVADALDALGYRHQSPRVALPERVGDFELVRKRCHGDSCFSIYRHGHIAEPAGGPGVSSDEKGGEA